MRKYLDKVPVCPPGRPNSGVMRGRWKWKCSTNIQCARLEKA